MTADLAARDVSIRFGGVQALDGVSLRVDEAEIVGILGPNGAGKTTLFNAISGFVTPDEGTIELRGRDVTTSPPHERAWYGLGRTFQQVGLIKSFSVTENVIRAQHASIGYGETAGLVGTRRARSEEAELRDRARVALDLLDLGAVADERAGDLPYGTMKMAEVAAVLATDPQVMLLDEPLAGASYAEGAEFCELLVRLRDRLGLSIVMIEHQVPLVLGTADYVYVLDMGQPLADGVPAEVRANPAVARAYMGEGATTLDG